MTMLGLNAKAQTPITKSLTLGVKQFSYSSSEVQIGEPSFNSVYAAFDLLPDNKYGIGFEFHHSINNSRFRLRDFRIKIGGIFNHGSRIQFPLYPSVSFYSFNDNTGEKYSTLGLGIMGGLKFYITDKLSVQGMYSLIAYAVQSINGNILDEARSISGKGIRVGLSYNFVKLNK